MAGGLMLLAWIAGKNLLSTTRPGDWWISGASMTQWPGRKFAGKLRIFFHLSRFRGMDRQDKSEDSAEWACSVRANACDADSRGNLRHRAFCSLWEYFDWFNRHEQHLSGTQILGGVAQTNIDLWFQEGISVPERRKWPLVRTGLIALIIVIFNSRSILHRLSA